MGVGGEGWNWLFETGVTHRLIRGNFGRPEIRAQPQTDRGRRPSGGLNWPD